MNTSRLYIVPYPPPPGPGGRNDFPKQTEKLSKRGEKKGRIVAKREEKEVKEGKRRGEKGKRKKKRLKDKK